MSNIPTHMRAALTRDWNDIRVEKVPVPDLEPGEVLVKVGAAGVCATDLRIAAGVYKGMWPPALPFIQGHEWGGTVAALGQGVTTLKVGDRVAAENQSGCGVCTMCRKGRYNLCEEARIKGKAYKLYGHTAPGSFAEYAARPALILHKIPDNVSFEESVLVNQGSLCLHGIRRCNVEAGETVAIIGPGLVGMMTLQLAHAVGATRVIVVGRGPRLELARELGATDLIDYTTGDPAEALLAMTGGGGVDCVFDCAGGVAALTTAVKAVKRGGRIGLIGLSGGEPVPIDTDRLALDEIDIFGVRSSPHAYPDLIKLIAAGKVNVRKLVSRVYPLEQINEAMKAFRAREGGAIRMVLKP